MKLFLFLFLASSSLCFASETLPEGASLDLVPQQAVVAEAAPAAPPSEGAPELVEDREGSRCASADVRIECEWLRNYHRAETELE